MSDSPVAPNYVAELPIAIPLGIGAVAMSTFFSNVERPAIAMHVIHSPLGLGGAFSHEDNPHTTVMIFDVQDVRGIEVLIEMLRTAQARFVKLQETDEKEGQA